MCWIGKTEDIRIAKEDIEVKKVLMACDNDVTGFFVSPYRNAPYKFDVIYEETITPRRSNHPFHQDDDTIIIDTGLHCYSAKCDSSTHESVLGGVTVMNIYLLRTFFLVSFKGTRESHNYVADVFKNPVLMKCIIPAGTTYYENKRGEIVSEKLIVKKRLT